MEAGSQCYLVLEHHDNEVFDDQEQDTDHDDSAGSSATQPQTNVIDVGKSLSLENMR